MTENKRFTYENHKVKDNLTGEVHSSNMVSVNVLNELNDENEQIKHAIIDALANERTAIGKSVLKQLLESLE